MVKEEKRNKVQDGIILITGCIITAFAAECILNPNGLTTSGITGLAIFLESILGISYIYLYYGFTVIIIITTWIVVGKKEVGKIVFLSILYPTILKVFQLLEIKIVLNDNLLTSIVFGVVFGVGVGLCMRIGFSFGGTDTIGKILHLKVFHHIKVGEIISILDSLIIILSIFSFGIRIALYAIIIQFIFCKVLDYVTVGFGTTLYKHDIISVEYIKISEYILKELGRGVTQKEVVGAYTGEKKTQISCVCSPKESMDIKKFILTADDAAYVEVTHITSVWGIGRRFKALNK